MKKKIIIVGAFHEIIELSEENNYLIVGIIDPQKKGLYRNYKVLCDDSGAKKVINSYKDAHFIITPDKPSIRKSLVTLYRAMNAKFCNLISQEARISKSASLGIGSIIQTGVNISAEAKIGDFVKLNTKCNVMHNSEIGNFTTIAPNAVVLGNVKIGSSCYIGANATILPNIKIFDNATVGAGAVVTKNVMRGKTVAGVPARIMLQEKNR